MVRAVRVLRALAGAQGGRRLSELSRELAIAKGTLSALLRTLERLDLVERDPETGAYRLAEDRAGSGPGHHRAQGGRRPRPRLPRGEGKGVRSRGPGHVRPAVTHGMPGVGSAARPGSDGRLLEEEHPKRQLQLIRSAYRLIGERGVDRASMREIAEAAGMSKGLIPYYFKTKENLILATMRWALSQTADRIWRAMAAATTPEDKVVAMVDAIFIEPEANRRFHVAYLDLVGYAARKQRYMELRATFDGIVNALNADVIRAGVAEGAFVVEDVNEAAMALRALVDGLFLQWLQEEDWRGQHARYREVCKREALQLLGARSRAATPRPRPGAGTGR